MTLPDDLLIQLKKSGWFPERKISLPADPRRHEAAQKFLENFGDIAVSRTNLDKLFGKIPGTTKSFVDWFDFCYERAEEAVYPEHTITFSKMLGRPLYVVGECDCGHTAIMIDDLGRFFRDCDSIMHPLALTVEQMLYNLWNGPHYDKQGLENIGSFDRKLYSKV